jgi:hypothetical protein
MLPLSSIGRDYNKKGLDKPMDTCYKFPLPAWNPEAPGPANSIRAEKPEGCPDFKGIARESSAFFYG